MASVYIERIDLVSMDIFSGLGSLTEGLQKADFNTKFAFELDESVARNSLNHYGNDQQRKNLLYREKRYAAG